MEEHGTAAEKADTAPHPDSAAKPDSPTDLKKPSWAYAFRSAVAEFSDDQCTDLGAGLTYYSVQSIFPALLALVSLLGVFGTADTVTKLTDVLDTLGTGETTAQLQTTIEEMVNNAGGASITLVLGVVLALWSASGYVNAFGRAMNRIYEVDEGRGFVKLRGTMLVTTIILVVMAALVLTGLAVSGSLAESIGAQIGLTEQTVLIWSIAKWPVILLIVVAMVALLYYATPNVRQPKFRWLSVGAAFAILTWVVASAAFGFYVANFSNYSKTYGAFASVIIFLLWLWITNLALLFGAEFDAELERARQLQAGIEAEESLQLPPRDDKASIKAKKKLDKRIAKGRQIRTGAQR